MRTVLPLLLALCLCGHCRAQDKTEEIQALLQGALTDVLPLQLQLHIEDLKPQGWSVAPFLGRDDKNGFVYGAGAFFYNDRTAGYDLSVYGVTNLRDFHSGTVVHNQRLPGRWRYGILTTFERAFDNYYGEGRDTATANPYYLRMDHQMLQATAIYSLWPKVGMGLGADWRRFHEISLERREFSLPGDPARLFPDEDSVGALVLAQHDSRNSLLFPTKGLYLRATGRWLPAGWTNLKDDENLVQGEVDGRFYQSICPGWVLAFHAMGGASNQRGGYLWRYRLGGVERLRGYSENRFRGRNFWAGQAELRFPIYKILTGAVGADVGDVSEDRFSRDPKATAQAGIRVALPPDWGQRARLEMGWGLDQWCFNVQFGEVF